MFLCNAHFGFICFIFTYIKDIVVYRIMYPIIKLSIINGFTCHDPRNGFFYSCED